MRLLYSLLDIPVFGSKLKNFIANKTGKMQESIFLREYTKYKYNVDIGLYSYGGCFSPEFNLGGKVSVGRYCSFASNIHYFGANHPIEYVSMSPYFYNKSFSKEVNDVKRSYLEVGHDCWIGYGVIITSNCNHIGNGAVVAAGSIVTKDVPAYAIVAGSPAKIIKYRFDKETIDVIEESRWWERKPKECLKYYKFIDKPLEFSRRIKNEVK